MLLNYHSCDWCGSDNFEVVVRGRDLLEGLPGEFQFVRCIKCGLFRQNPRLDWEELSSYYPENYAAYQPQISEIKNPIKKRDKSYGLWKRLRLVEKYRLTGDWFDIGCGSGRILEYAQRRNAWKLSGLEPVRNIADSVRRKLSIDIVNSTIEDYVGAPESFDLITMFDVLEHLPYPIKAISKVSGLLITGGYFIFSIPNYESFNRRLFNKFWSGYDLPRHLYLFPREKLSEQLADNGLMIIEQKCVAGGFMASILDLRFWATAHNHEKWNSALSQLSENLFVRLIFSPFFWILDLLKASPYITVVAQKK